MTNKHNYFCCPKIDLESKMIEINKFSKDAIKRTLKGHDLYKKMPAEVFEHDNFPARYLGKPQRQRYVLIPRKEKKQLAQQSIVT